MEKPMEILIFAHKLTGQSKTFIGNILVKKWTVFIMFVYQIVLPANPSHYNIENKK